MTEPWAHQLEEFIERDTGGNGDERTLEPPRGLCPPQERLFPHHQHDQRNQGDDNRPRMDVVEHGANGGNCILAVRLRITLGPFWRRVIPNGVRELLENDREPDTGKHALDDG